MLERVKFSVKFHTIVEIKNLNGKSKTLPARILRKRPTWEVDLLVLPVRFSILSFSLKYTICIAHKAIHLNIAQRALQYSGLGSDRLSNAKSSFSRRALSRALSDFPHPFQDPDAIAIACRFCLVQSIGMPFSRLLKNFSHPSPARSGPTDAESNTSDDSNVRQRGRQANESKATIRRPWKAKRPSSTDHSSPSQPKPTPPLTPKAKGTTTESGADEDSSPTPSIPNVPRTNVSVVPSPEMVPTVGSVTDKLADAWDLVKDDPKIAKTSRALDTVGVSSVPSNLLWFAYRPSPGL